jgi:hypothetical protein
MERQVSGPSFAPIMCLQKQGKSSCGLNNALKVRQNLRIIEYRGQFTAGVRFSFDL